MISTTRVGRQPPDHCDATSLSSSPSTTRKRAPTVLRPELLAVLESLGLRFEVIFMDNGSSDRSAAIIRGFHEADSRIRLLRLKTNAGEVAAIDAGFNAARGRWVIVMHADLQNDPHDIPKLLQHLDRWHAVSGWRLNRDLGESPPGIEALLRRGGSGRRLRRRRPGAQAIR